jgi:hypothetical protein
LSGRADFPFGASVGAAFTGVGVLGADGAVGASGLALHPAAAAAKTTAAKNGTIKRPRTLAIVASLRRTVGTDLGKASHYTLRGLFSY